MQNTLSCGHYNHIVIHTPHAGTILPMDFRILKHPDCVKFNNFLSSSICHLFEQLTDHYTDKLFSCIVQLPTSIRPYKIAHEYIEQISFPYSRLFCDVERLPNDPLEEQGLGIHYDLSDIERKNNGRLWTKTKEDAMKLYNEHQDKLASAFYFPVGSFWRESLLLDCHSFSERDNVLCPNAHEYKDIDICIGFNEDETKPSWEFIDSVKGFFTSHGYRVEYNLPFSNCKTVQHYKDEYNRYHKPRYHSLMIEVNKHCYMNEDTLEITYGYYKLHKELQELYKALLSKPKHK